MRIQKTGIIVKIWLSARDTYAWANNRPGASWPCSQLSGHRLFAEFDDGDLVDMTIDGKDRDCDVNEFSAITDDAIAGKL